VNDLDYADILSRTGSKTVFPANDEAFDRFFASGQWPNVRKYEDLSTAQKKLLLYTSMLDNAMLVNMMSNVAGSGDVIRGEAMKHATSVSVIDTVAHVQKASELYVNNPYFKRFDQRQGGLHYVTDATTPMMIHFTREFMLNHALTTSGSQSDFSVLMGQEYDEKEQPGYVFRNKIIHKDVTCQNGYIHQVENVVVPPGNMAQLLKSGDDTKLFSRMLDRFAIPVYNRDVTRDYQASAAQYGWETIDSIFEIRYMSTASYDNKVQKDPDGNNINTGWLLRFDPGWNQYYLTTGQSGNGDGKQSDVAAILVPEDEAVRGYFLPAGAYNGNQGSGAFLIDRYGKKPNTLENLEENIDSIPQDKIQTILRNLMQTQFTKTVPSLFDAVTDNASDLMGLTLNDVRKDGNGAYDVRIANNGVLYVLNRMIAPPDFSSVLAPALVSDIMHVVNWIIQNHSATGYSGSSTVNKYDYSIDLDYYTYLLAMSANYVQFLPTDAAFGTYYVNAASLSTLQPEVVHFFFDTEKYKATSGLGVSHWKYDPVTRQVGDSIGEYDLAKDISVQGRPAYQVVKSLLNELINMHTIVLKKGEVLGQNKYYTTKLGAGVKATGNTEGSTVATSAQLSGMWPQPAAISKVYPESNGVAYQLDGLLQPPTQSVYSVLKNNPQFSEFLELCMFFDNTDFLKWLGINTDYDTETKMRQSDQYLVFEKPHSKEYNAENDESTNAPYMMATYENDYVVKFFNTFNYTVYAPNNAAMQKAYANGLPNYQDILDEYEKSEAGLLSDDYATVSARLLEQVKLLRQFVRYHFQNSTVFANTYGNSDDLGYHSTFTPDANNINLKLNVTSISNGTLKVKDAAGREHVIVDEAPGKVANAMTRDVILDARFDRAKTVYTSSFAVVHEIDEALCPCSDGKFNTLLANYGRRR
jgi:uncharacterized surface protein with fasciclin (FAS1) repeats